MSKDKGTHAVPAAHVIMRQAAKSFLCQFFLESTTRVILTVCCRKSVDLRSKLRTNWSSLRQALHHPYRV